MIQAFFSALFTTLFATIPHILLRIGYGKRGMEILFPVINKNKKLKIFMYLLGFGMLFGVLGILNFLADPFSSSTLDFLLSLLPFVIYIFWSAFTRKNVDKKIEQYKEQLQREEKERQEHLQENRKVRGWKCHGCGRMNTATDIYCPDCGTYQ